MSTYVVLLRGINVGGKNKLPMAALKQLLEEQGYRHVVPYIQSGNVVLQSEHDAPAIARQLESDLIRHFKLDSALIRVLVLTAGQLQAVIEHKPAGFGDQPDTYHSDVIFLMDVDAADALPAFSPREGVDAVWPGDGVIYSQRLSAERTKSRLNRIMSSPLYQTMTIRNWNTTTKLLDIVRQVEGRDDG